MQLLAILLLLGSCCCSHHFSSYSVSTVIDTTGGNFATGTTTRVVNANLRKDLTTGVVDTGDAP
jgi:hypothetical protein